MEMTSTFEYITAVIAVWFGASALLVVLLYLAGRNR